MNPAIKLDNPEIAGLHAALQREYGCRLSAIIGMTDTEVKMTAVFVLAYFYRYSARNIAGPYSICYCYVPTVVSKMIDKYLLDPEYRNIVMRVLNEMEWSDEKN